MNKLQQILIPEDRDLGKKVKEYDARFQRNQLIYQAGDKRKEYY
jgi:hypothetical protein